MGREELFDKSNEVICLLASTHKDLTMSRKMNIKQSISHNLQHLCTRDHVEKRNRRYNEDLFEEDLGCEIDAAVRAKRVVQKVGSKNGMGRGRGYNRNPPRRGVGKMNYKKKNQSRSSSKGRGHARSNAQH